MHTPSSSAFSAALPNALAPLRVCVLAGGWSAERDVSRVSGEAVAKSLTRLGHQVTVIDPSVHLPTFIQDLQAARPDVVFNALHGKGGEDGQIQSVLDYLNLAYTHSSRLASAVAMDKPMTKALVGAQAVPSPAGRLVTSADFANGHPHRTPYILKPFNEGSSVGVRLVQSHDNLPFADSALWPYDGPALLEDYIPGRELTVGILGDAPLGVTEIIAKTSFFDYDAKYTDGLATHVFPAAIPDAIAKRVMDYALTAHRALGCRGISRSDFRYNPDARDDRNVFFLEINTQPGFTPLSLVPEQAAGRGISFDQLVTFLLHDALNASLSAHVPVHTAAH